MHGVHSFRFSSIQPPAITASSPIRGRPAAHRVAGEGVSAATPEQRAWAAGALARPLPPCRSGCCAPGMGRARAEVKGAGHQQKGAPDRGAFTPVAAIVSSHQELPIGCLVSTHDLSGAWQEREGITSPRRDARSLTSTAVIRARVMQPGISTRGNQKWHMACPIIWMAFAHWKHLHLRSAHRLG